MRRQIASVAQEFQFVEQSEDRPGPELSIFFHCLSSCCLTREGVDLKGAGSVTTGVSRRSPDFVRSRKPCRPLRSWDPDPRTNSSIWFCFRMCKVQKRSRVSTGLRPGSTGTGIISCSARRNKGLSRSSLTEVWRRTLRLVCETLRFHSVDAKRT